MNELSQKKSRVLVTICTRGRWRLLQAGLDSVCAQLPSLAASMDILVVENNATLTVTDLVERQRLASGRTIHLVVEPELGIPFARNRCGTFAQSNGYDWALYIDDDEVARPNWFQTMVEASQTYEADVIYGRVVSVYPGDTPQWMIVPEIDKRARGTVLKKAEGHNTLVHTRVFDPKGFALRFDETMRFTGGSDTDFFSRVAQAGGRIVWVGDAIVDELVPETRTTLRWQLYRTFRVAVNIAVQHEKTNGKAAACLRTATKGLGRVADGLIRLPLAIVTPIRPTLGKRFAFQAAKQLASGLGSFAYITGHRPQPYRQVDGN